MRVVYINDFVKEEDNLQWLVDGLLPNVGWTYLIGEKGNGKSTFAVQMCAAMQAGIPFLERETLRSKILYIQADSPTMEWREILRRVAPTSRGLTLIDVPARALDNPTYVGYIIRVIDQVKPEFLVFDSLYNLTSVNINTDQALIAINQMKGLAQENPWLLIHHPPRHESRASGHNSISGNCSNEWFLSKNKLRIDKGRLVAEKEVLLSRDKQGLWVPFTGEETNVYGGGTMDKLDN